MLRIVKHDMAIGLAIAQLSTEISAIGSKHGLVAPMLWSYVCEKLVRSVEQSMENEEHRGAIRQGMTVCAHVMSTLDADPGITKMMLNMKDKVDA
jgi:hypothetical protein